MNNNAVFINNILITSYFTKYIAKNDFENYYDSFQGFNDKALETRNLQSVLPRKLRNEENPELLQDQAKMKRLAEEKQKFLLKKQKKTLKSIKKN